MRNSIKISIIIPCYNTKVDYLADAIDSVINQNFSDYEIIIIDDGSDEYHHNALQSYLADFANVILITTENKGASSARNTGVRAASGKYITFLDADDVLSSGFLVSAYSIAEKEGADFVIGGVKQIQIRPEKHKPCEEETKKIQYEIYDDRLIEEFIRKMIDTDIPIKLSEGAYIGRGPVSRLIKRDLANNNTFDNNLMLGEDLVWNILTLRSAKKVCMVYKNWYWYWQNPTSVTHSYNRNIYYYYNALLETLYRLIDLRDDKNYIAYINRVYDGIYQVYKLDLSMIPVHDKHGEMIKNNIMTLFPWTLLREKKYRGLSKTKMKVYSLLYKYNLLFLSLKVRLKLGL